MSPAIGDPGWEAPPLSMEGAWILAWVGLGIWVLVLHSYGATKKPVMYSLILFGVYTLLTNVERIAPLVDRSIAPLRWTRPAGGGQSRRAP